MRWICGALMGLCWVAAAGAQASRHVTLTGCTSGSCQVSVANMGRKVVLVDYASGTLNVDVTCRLRDSAGPLVALVGPEVTVGGALSATPVNLAAVTADKAVLTDAPCYAVNVAVTTCTSCVYSVVVQAIPLVQ